MEMHGSVSGSPDLLYQLTDGDFVEPRSKKSLLVCLIRRRFYIFIFLTLSAIAWLFIYYKVLDHRFELPGPLRELQRFFGDGDAKHRRRPTPGDDSELSFNVTKLPKKTRNSQQIHIGIVACTNREKDALLSLSMIARVSKHCLHFHIFAQRQGIFEAELNKWEGWIEGWIEFETFPLQYPWSESASFWREVTDDKLCENQMLFTPDIFSDLDSIIFIETDALFLRPPEDLWRLLQRFNESQIFGMVYGNEEISGWESNLVSASTMESSDELERLGVSTGVLLMNLTRIREYNWERRTRDFFESHSLRSRSGIITREIIFALCRQDPGILYRLPCSWNYGPDNCELENNCADAKKQGIGALQRCRERWSSTAKNKVFQVIYDAVKDFELVGGNFSDSVVRIEKKLRHVQKSGCSKMKKEFLKYLKLIE